MNPNIPAVTALNGLQQLVLEELALRYMGPVYALNQYGIDNTPALCWESLTRDVLLEVAQSNVQYTEFSPEVGLSHLLSLYFNIGYEAITLNPSENKPYWVALFPKDGYVKEPERATLYRTPEEAVCKTVESLNLLYIVAQESGIASQWYQQVQQENQTHFQ